MTDAIETIDTLKRLEVASFQAARLATKDSDAYAALVLFTSLTRSARETAEIRAYEATLPGVSRGEGN